MHLQRFLVLSVLCLAAMVSQFYRAANSVLAAPVMADLSLPPAAYGGMTAAFFVAFMLTQVPAGILLDRYGPRLTISGLLLFAVAGALLFAAGDRLVVLIAARVLLGVGCAAVIMGAFIAISGWFPARHFALISSVIISTSHLGNLLATAPLGYSVETIGWRGSFVALAGVTLVASLLVYLLVRDTPRPRSRQAARSSWSETLKGSLSILRMRDIQRAFVLALVGYPSMITILGLWGGPYLQTRFGLTSSQVGEVLLVMPASSLVGALCFGPLDQLFNSRKRAVLAGIVPLGLLLLALGIHPAPSLTLVTLFLGAIAFFSAASMLIIAHGRGLLPDHLAGRGITTINIGIIGGAALFQLCSSLLLDAYIGPQGVIADTGFRVLFTTMGSLVLLAVLVYLPARDVHPRQLTGKPSA